MVSVEKAVIAKLKRNGETFEVLVDCEKAMAFKEGKSISMDDVLAVSEVFSDAKKGLAASEKRMEAVFGTADPFEVAKIIIKEGEVQLTAAYREKLRERVKKQIIDILHRNGIDPRTNAPHPPARLEAALEEAKVKIDETKPASEQVERILKQIRPILPIRFAKKEIAIKIKSDYAGKAYPFVQKSGKILKQEWQNDGSLIAVIEIPGGIEEEFYDQLNKITHGTVETKLLKVHE